MTDLRELCRCQHVRNSHREREGVCKTCGICRGWVPAYPVFDEALPAGVVADRHYESLGLTLVACTHDLRWRREGRCQFCFGDAQTTNDFVLEVRRLVFAPVEQTLFV